MKPGFFSPRRQRWAWMAGLIAGGLAGAWADQTRIPDYEAARKLFWGEVYRQGGETLYCGKAFSAGDHRGVNIEHIFPMSWVTNALDCGTRDQCRNSDPRFNRIEADLHNMYPALTAINDARGSASFGMIDGEKREYGSCDFELDQRHYTVEPRDTVRGEIARAMFYMHDEYGLEIRPRQGKTLKRWNQDDPPSADEKRRNDLIEKLEGKRNPYIDDPELAKKLWF